MARFQPGDRVRVKSKNGDGHGVFLGIDERSGMPRVAVEKIVVDDGKEKKTLAGVEMYATHKSLRRE